MLSPHSLTTTIAASSSTSFFDAAALETKQASLFDYQLPLREDMAQTRDSGDDDPTAQRPGVARVSSAPEASSSAPTMFVESYRNSLSRPSVARACSEGSAYDGVLGRRRRACMADQKALPSVLILDLAQLPNTIVAGNINLLKAARRAVTEPREFDWQHSTPAPTKARKNEPRLRIVLPQPVLPTVAASPEPAPTTITTTTKSQSYFNKRTIQNTKSCIARYWNKPVCSYEDEWEWALSGNARATTEAIKCSTYVEKKEAVHDIWQQLPDWVSRRSSLGGRDADMSLRGPALHNCMSALQPLTVPEHS